jgi:hypothetical protein
VEGAMLGNLFPMNLAAIVAQATAETGYTDTDDVTFAKGIARQWDEFIWNSALWKDALYAVDIAVTPATDDDHAEGVILLPELIDRVVGVRTLVNSLRVQAIESLYRLDFDKFNEEGTPWQFVILPPIWYTWRPVSGSGSYISLSPIDQNGTDGALNVKIIWIDQLNIRHVVEGVMAASALQMEPPNSGTRKVVIESVFKPDTSVAVGLYPEGADVPGGELATIDADKTRSPLYQRVRLLPKPIVDTTVTVLGKRIYEPLTFDYQEPALRNLTNCLTSYIRGSLKRRGGENGDAQQHFGEAQAELLQLQGIEAVQAANFQRLTPESGMQTDYDPRSNFMYW